jgi:hypothetical protein
MYERLVAAFEADAADMGTSVTPNASLIGSISGAPRQIDVLVDARFEGDCKRRIVLDAKLRSRKVDVKDVESFEGMMRDVGASRGILVCTKGYTEAARRRADQFIDVRIMEEDEAMEHDFSMTDPCPRCLDLHRMQQGVVFWDGQFPLPLDGAWAIVFTGKCDGCRSFAFWCWDCGDKKVVPDGVVHECGCARRWFTEATEDEVSFIVALEDGEVPLDRRPLR